MMDPSRPARSISCDSVTECDHHNPHLGLINLPVNARVGTALGFAAEDTPEISRAEAMVLMFGERNKIEMAKLYFKTESNAKLMQPMLNARDLPKWSAEEFSMTTTRHTTWPFSIRGQSF